MSAKRQAGCFLPRSLIGRCGTSICRSLILRQKKVSCVSVCSFCDMKQLEAITASPSDMKS